jgi:DNA repair protein RadC
MTIVSPVEIFRPAIMLRATSIIMAHQHPSGDPEPSRQDMEATVRLKTIGDTIGISLTDHFVIGNNSYSSLRQMGLIR